MSVCEGAVCVCEGVRCACVRGAAGVRARERKTPCVRVRERRKGMRLAVTEIEFQGADRQSVMACVSVRG